MKGSQSDNNGEILYIELKHLTKDAESKVTSARKKLSRYFSHAGSKSVKPKFVQKTQHSIQQISNTDRFNHSGSVNLVDSAYPSENHQHSIHNDHHINGHG